MALFVRKNCAKFTAGHLKAALNMAVPFTYHARNVPALSCVLIRADLAGAEVLASDVDSMIRVPIAAGVSDAFSVMCEAEHLRRLVNTIPSETIVEIEAGDGEDRRAFLLWPGARYRLLTQNPENFAHLKFEFSSEAAIQVVSVDSDDFRQTLAQVLPAVSTEETRYYLNGVAIVWLFGQNHLVATDGHRMAWAPLDNGRSFSSRLEGSPIIPRPIVARIAKSGALQPRSLAFSKSAPVVSIRCAGGVTITAKLIDGVFPDVERVIPKPAETDIVAEIERRPLRDSLRRMVSVMPSRARFVTMRFAEPCLYLGAQHADLQGTAERVGAYNAIQGGPIDIGVNAAYVLEMLERIQARDTGPARFRFKSPADPIFIEGERVRCVLMPARISIETPAGEIENSIPERVDA